MEIDDINFKTIPSNCNKVIYNYIIYHKNCIDGFSGFYLFLKSSCWEKGCIVFPDVPSAKHIPPEIDGKNIIIIDVAYQLNILKQIADRANKVLFLDHHITIADQMQNLKLGDPHEIVFDNTKSGVSLVWDYFFSKKIKKIPDFVKYIEDNDIGKWKYPNTMPFISAIEVNLSLDPTWSNLKKWDIMLNKKEVDNLIKKGKMYQEYKEYLLNNNSKKYSLLKFPGKKLYDDNKKFFESPGQYTVASHNGSGCPTTSLLGKKLVDNIECDFALIWTYQIEKREVVVSMRSKKTDVGQIAKQLGGGGHTFAAAFSFNTSKYDITDLFL
ncbi:MAG: hypothetical protein Edafosvirus10_22 [Edafosvirus sp.]|uniref:DHHA1 domain-containing protein n=1 Tax=Edafosvirus sp. TaxID=2487765 RepID=A0A3G4ZTY3_9VIRU|nr:MAG: hypothetical protein Edafosvirus10_22 [Edafosvirus sp.]